MPSRREKRLPSSSSKFEFVDNEKKKDSSKRCFVRSFAALGLSLVAIAAIVVVIVVWFPTSASSDKSAETNHETQCSFPDEARRIGLEQFLEKLRSEFHKRDLVQSSGNAHAKFRGSSLPAGRARWTKATAGPSVRSNSLWPTWA